RAKTAYELPDTLLPTMNNLAITYQQAGKFDLGVPLLEETLRLDRAKRGPDHPETWKTMWNLALAFRRAGQPEKAASVHQEMLDIKTKHGESDPGLIGQLGIDYAAAAQ